MAKKRPRYKKKRYMLPAGFFAFTTAVGALSDSEPTEQPPDSLSFVEAESGTVAPATTLTSDASLQALVPETVERTTTTVTPSTIAPTTTVPPTTTPTTPAPTAPPTPAPTPEPQNFVSYANCTEVREAGAAPIRRGQPGYAGHLDRDGDGIGCE